MPWPSFEQAHDCYIGDDDSGYIVEENSVTSRTCWKFSKILMKQGRGAKCQSVQDWPEGLRSGRGSLHRHTSFIRNRKSTSIQPDQAVCHNDLCRSDCNRTLIPVKSTKESSPSV